MNPVPSPDAAVRLSVEASADPYSTQPLDVTRLLASAITLQLPQEEADASSAETQKLPRPRWDDPPIRVQRIDQPAEATGQTQERSLRPGKAQSIGWEWPLILGVLVVIGVAAYQVFARGPVVRSLPPAAGIKPESLPAGVQVQLDQALAGDAHAMRMLGVMYYYGLNVPQDREKGLYWYRKAAEKGSDAARAELNKIERGR